MSRSELRYANSDSTLTACFLLHFHFLATFTLYVQYFRCGPCKVIAPKFEDFSEKYTDAVFLKVIGDASPDASKLMKREGVRSVPSFHYFKDGEKVDVVNGANAEAIEACITKHM